MLSLLTLVSFFTFARAASSVRCPGTITSLSDVSAAVQCKTVNIHAFTVPAGKTFSLDLLEGTTVNVLGDIRFETLHWDGPLFQVTGKDITFNGNGKVWDGGGPFYWDGLGGSGGVTKPLVMMNLQISGKFSNVHVLNSPTRAIAVDSGGPMVIRGIRVDNRQGASPNAKSGGLPAGRNTDGIGVIGRNIIIENSSVTNQDDCVAIVGGKNIVFRNNHCIGGHGASIGSIPSNTIVEDVLFQGNTIINSQQAFRIKTDKVATNSRVTNITYSDNIAKGCTSYGVLITQSYPSELGTPGNGVIISDIKFHPQTTDISVMSGAQEVVVDCGSNSCSGLWNWSGLVLKGGKKGMVTNIPEVTGYDL